MRLDEEDACMRKVYICSPYRGNVERNVDDARRYCRMAVDDGFIPVAPHIYFTQFLDDSVENERKAGIEAGIQLMLECDEMWVFGEPTEGMMKEIECARSHEMKIVMRTCNG